MSLRKAATVARAATKNQLSSDEDEGSDGWDGGKGSKSKMKARTRRRTSEDGGVHKKRGRPRALTIGLSGTGPDSPQPTPKARKSLDSPRKAGGTKRQQPSTALGSDSELSELSSLEDLPSPTHQQVTASPTPSRAIHEQVNIPPSSTGQDIQKHKPLSSPITSRSLIPSASFTLGASPKTPADTSRVRNILSGVMGSSKSVLSRTISSPNITFSPPTISFSREAWSRDKLGSCVWVLVDRSGHPQERRGKGEAYWWPAEVISSMFGEFPFLRCPCRSYPSAVRPLSMSSSSDVYATTPHRNAVCAPRPVKLSGRCSFPLAECASHRQTIPTQPTALWTSTSLFQQNGRGPIWMTGGRPQQMR